MNDCTLTPAEPMARIVPIAGAHNLRDMGGYASTDGRTLRWRQLYRSGQMNDITHDEIAALGIVAICHLRDNRERMLRPTQWHDGRGVDYWCRDYALSAGDLHRVGDAAAAPRREMLATMISVYRELLYEQAPSYRELFRRLIAGQLPLLFNCAAGKDRTGIAAALILAALGVPRETIAEDYVLTNHNIDRLKSSIFSDPKYARLRHRPAEQYMPLLRADPAYLAAMFEEIDRRHGSVAGYLGDVLDIGATDMVKLQENLLETMA